MHMCVQRPDVVTDYLASPLFLREGLPRNPESAISPGLAGQPCLGCLSLGLQQWGLSRAPLCLAFTGLLGIQTWVPIYVQRALSLLGHFPCSRPFIWGPFIFCFGVCFSFFKSRHIYTFNCNEELAFLNKVLEVTKI